MSIIACGSSGIGKFNQPLVAILKNAATAASVQVCYGPISSFVPSISINTSAKFGAFITK